MWDGNLESSTLATTRCIVDRVQHLVLID